MDLRSSGIVAVLAVSTALILTGCSGKSSPNPGNTTTVERVTLTPTSGSIDVGATLTFSATAVDRLGNSVPASNIHYVPGCGTQQPCAPLSISTSGLACAGSWDSLTNPLVCTPGTSGVAQVTAESFGVSSPPAIVYVHQHIESIQVTPVGTAQCSKPPCTCFSQGETFNYQAKAFSNGADITSAVGPLTWSSSPANVVTTNTGASGLLLNQVQTTAKDPGITQLFASVSGVTSNPVPYTTCLVQSIMLQIQSGTGNLVNLNAGGSKAIQATVLDTMDNLISSPPLTWSTSDPEIASFSSVSTANGSNSITTKQSAGGADVFASCTPPSCNIGVLPGLPVYSSGGTLKNGEPGFGVIKVRVTTASGSKPPTFTAWAATTGCGTALNCASVMFPVTPATNPIGNGVTLPRTPNSLMFTPLGTRIYIGSDQGLMFLDVSGTTVSAVSAATTPCNVALCGRVLAISPDGNRAVVTDTQSVPNQVYIYDNTRPTTPVSLLIDGATAAAFSPDEMKVFILSNTGQMFVFSAVDSLRSVPISASATDVAFSADGSFAYVAGTPSGSVSGFATCDLKDLGASSPPPASTPIRIFPLPDVREDHILINSKIPPEHSVITQDLLALEPPNIQRLTAQFTRDVLDEPGQFTCNNIDSTKAQTDPVFLSYTAGPAFNLGIGNFTPLEMKVVGNGSQAILVAQNVPAVLTFDVNAGTTSAIPLVNNGVPLVRDDAPSSPASVSPDGTTVFVGACESFETDGKTCKSGSVHIVNMQAGADIQQAVFTDLGTNNSMCSNLDPNGPPCLPDLIAVKPQ